jgi:hypothetical protein
LLWCIIPVPKLAKCTYGSSNLLIVSFESQTYLNNLLNLLKLWDQVLPDAVHLLCRAIDGVVAPREPRTLGEGRSPCATLHLLPPIGVAVAGLLAPSHEATAEQLPPTSVAAAEQLLPAREAAADLRAPAGFGAGAGLGLVPRSK